MPGACIIFIMPSLKVPADYANKLVDAILDLQVFI